MSATAQDENTRSAGDSPRCRLIRWPSSRWPLELPVGYFARGSASPAAPTDAAADDGSTSSRSSAEWVRPAAGNRIDPTAAGELLPRRLPRLPSRCWRN